MAITIISGSIPANIGQLNQVATATISLAWVSASYSTTYVSSSATASLREASITAFNVNGTNFVFYTGSAAKTNTANTVYINSVPFNTSAAGFCATASLVFDATASAQNSTTAYSQLQGVSSTDTSTNLEFAAGAIDTYVYANNIEASNFVTSGSTTTYFSGATNVVAGGSATVTGSFTSVYAEVDSDITVSGSGIGEATFLLGRGNTYVPSSSIASIIVNNPFGYVVAQ